MISQIRTEARLQPGFRRIRVSPTLSHQDRPRFRLRY